MEIALTLTVLVALVVGFAVRANYRGHIQDLRSAIAYERKMRKYEENRADALSDALFTRAKTRAPNNSGMRN